MSTAQWFAICSFLLMIEVGIWWYLPEVKRIARTLERIEKLLEKEGAD